MPLPVTPEVPITPVGNAAGPSPGSPDPSASLAPSGEQELSESHTPQGSPTSPRPLLPPTPASSVTSPTSPCRPAGSLEYQYAISPHKLHAKNCPCLRPRRQLTTAHQHIQYMVGRFAKVMERMTGHSQIVSTVRDALLRVLYALRGRGWELFHMAGWEGAKNGGKTSRREYHIVFMLPDGEEPSCHRVLAEVMMHCIDHGQFRGLVENVATRFAEDWDDWTVSLPSQLVNDVNAPPPKHIKFEADKLQGRSAIFEAIWSEVLATGNDLQEPTKRDFLYRLGRTCDQLDEDGEMLVGVQLEVVGRTRSLSQPIEASPTIRIPLLARKKVASGTGKETGLESEAVGGQNSAAGKLSRPAAILIDLPKLGPRHKAKHIYTVYNGEWPVAHHYRNSIRPLTMPGLERLLVQPQ